MVEFFGELMRSEGLIPSLDPPSNRLNSAKPERHLGSTDGMVAVLTAREDGVSPYMLYEISLCLRTKKPLLVFLEDVLPNGLVPRRVLQRRFSRRGLLRQVRSHRHAIDIMKSYLGENPPPQYQPAVERRSCLIVGHTALPKRARDAIVRLLDDCDYTPVVVDVSNPSLIYDRGRQEQIASADLAVCFVDAPDAGSHLVLGAARAFLTPAILLTTDSTRRFHPDVPVEYQPRIVAATHTPELRKTLREEIEIFEEEYVDLEDQGEVARYTELLINEASSTGTYAADVRKVFIGQLMQIGKLTMSQDNIHIERVSGIVNVKSSLQNVSQMVGSSASLSDENKTQIRNLLEELQKALEPVANQHPDDAERVIKSAEMVISEASKEKPNKSFLKVTAEGLKEAAKTLGAIAPSVLSVATKLAKFVLAL